MNGSRCSGLLHCHYFLYAYPCLCCSHLHTDMSNFHPHEGILYVRIQHLASQKWALSSDISKALHVLAHHPNRQLPLVLRAMHEMENGCLPRLLPNVSGLHTKMHVRAQWQLLQLHCSCNGIHVLMHARQHQWVTCILMIFFLLCASPFGAGMPNPGERLGFNLVCKKCSQQNYKRGGGGQKTGG